MIYKILLTFYILLLSTTLFSKVSAQGMTISKYGVPVITHVSQYQASVHKDSLKKMVELKSINHTIKYELRYAGTDNFMKRRMYPARTNNTFMRAPAADALMKVQDELKEQGLGLKVFDAYRPYSVTVKFWELVKDERYVANPSKGSGHNRGLAIDLTIIELQSGKELDMGTGFDNFSDSAHHDFRDLPEKILSNRSLLRKTMEKHGFTLFETEWWHYYWPNNREYEMLDLNFNKLLSK